MKQIIVQKFGGTSVGTGERLLGVADIVRKTLMDRQVVVVVSALNPGTKVSGTTSLLLKAADQAVQGKDFEVELAEIRKTHLTALTAAVKAPSIRKEVEEFIDKELAWTWNFLDAITVIRELTPRSQDNVIATGEVLSARLLAAALQDTGIEAEFIDLSEALSDDFGEPDAQFYKKLQMLLAKKCEPTGNRVPVVTGYFGPVKGGLVEKIGRGYTDLTAALISAGLGPERVEEMQVWKEVDGVCSADPRRVSDAKVLTEISSDEASELTYFGSEVLHPFTMERVTSYSIPIRVKNTFNPDGRGTKIVSGSSQKDGPIAAITAKKGITVVTVKSNRMYHAHGFLAKLFDVLRQHEISVNLVSTSEVSVSFSLDNAQGLNGAVSELSEFGEVSVAKDRAILAAVGDGMQGVVGVPAKVFGSLAEANIKVDMISQGASRVNVSCVISEEDVDKAVQAVHRAFF